MTIRPNSPGQPAASPLERAPTGAPPTGAGTGARLAVALAAAAAVGVFGHFLDEPAAAAESAYLALLVAPLLAAVAVLQLPLRGLPRSSGEAGPSIPRADLGLLPWAAVLVVLLAWIVEPGSGRGAALVAFLVALLAWSGGWRLATARTALDGEGAAGTWGPAAPDPASGRAEVAPRDDGATPASGLPTAAARRPGGGSEGIAVLSLAAALVPLAVALQVLFRSGRLLGVAPDPRSLVVLLAWPAAAGLAVALLARRHGLGGALLAGATAILITGGLDRASVVALAALAAGELLRRPFGASATGRWGWRLCAVLVLAAPFAWQIRIPGLALAAAVLLAWPVRGALPVMAAGVAAALLFPLHGWPRSLDSLGMALLLLPVLPVGLAARVAGARRRKSASRRAGDGAPTPGAAGVHSSTLAAWLLPLAALVLAVVAVRSAPGGALAAPLALLALVLFPPRREKDGETVAGRALAVQGLWSGALLAATVVAAAYPWLRHRPSRAVLEAVGLEASGAAPLAVAAGASLLVVAAVLVPGGSRLRARGALLAGVLLLAVLLGQGPGTTLLGNPGVLLSTDEPRVELAATSATEEGMPLSQLAVFGSLAHAAMVADGTPVARVGLMRGEAEVASWTLRAGEDLAEWAARRPDVAAELAHRPPSPWSTWVAGDDLYGQTYRALHRFDAPVRADRLVVERAPDLPPGVTVHVRRLEGWR